MKYTTLKSTRKLSVPYVKSFEDYHGITDTKEELHGRGFDDIKSKEVGFDGRYWGLFYVGKLPKSYEIRTMLAAYGFDFVAKF